MRPWTDKICGHRGIRPGRPGWPERPPAWPAGLPAVTIERINHLVASAITAPAIRTKLSAQLMEPIPDTPAEFRARIDSDIARWKPIIDAAKIKIN